MIKGPLNEYDERFGDNVNSFIKLVSFINIEYKTINEKDAESVKKTLFFEFNGYKSINRYSKGLETSYNRAIAEIEETLLINFRKEDRLTYIFNLSLKFSEVKRFLRKTSESGYTHKNLINHNVNRINKNKKEVNDESFYQEYYHLIGQYLKKIILYLKNLRKLHNKLNDSEISVHKINVSAKYESTKESPLKFFQYLITKKGVSNLLQQFKPSKDDFSKYDIEYNDDSNTITYNHFDVETLKHSNTALSFNDYLLKRLHIESKKFKRLIRNQFKALKDESQATFFLNRTLNNLKTLAKNIENVKGALGYAVIKKEINVLIKHFKSNYAVFITPEKITNDNTYSFKLKGAAALIHDKAKNLHSSLVVNGFLSVDSKNDFVKLFTGQKPPNKILWIGNKSQLKSLIKLMLSQDKINNCKGKKWQITAANFRFSDGDFTNDDLNNIKYPKSQRIIVNIISKISG